MAVLSLRKQIVSVKVLILDEKSIRTYTFGWGGRGIIPHNRTESICAASASRSIFPTLWALRMLSSMIVIGCFPCPDVTATGCSLRFWSTFLSHRSWSALNSLTRNIKWKPLTLRAAIRRCSQRFASQISTCVIGLRCIVFLHLSNSSAVHHL